MARAAGKKTPRASTQTAPVTASKSTSTSIPEPFVPVPTSLQSLVATLPKDHVYAVHIDRTPVDMKRRVWVTSLLLNVAITAVLAWRVWYIAPTYLEQLITIFGWETAWKVDPSEMGTGDLMGTITSRTFLLMVDYGFFGILGRWPWEFIFGSKYTRLCSPWEWRTTLGFQKTEIVVRKGRKWDQALLIGEDEGIDKRWSLDEELTLKFKVQPAMLRNYTQKTGYLLLDKDWDLDFRAIIDVHKMVDSGALKLEDLDHIVLVHYQKQWLLWRVHEAVDKIAEQMSAATADEDVTLSTFRAKLSKMGLEDVFFRWIETVQYETSLPGGFTPGKQAEAIRDLKAQLTDRGVNYAKFWDEIGGERGLPGLG